MFARILPLITLIAFALPLRAAPVDDVFRALDLPGILSIMGQEGINYGTELEAKMFPGRGGAQWQEAVTGFYDNDLLEQVMHDTLAEELKDVDLAPLIAFLTAPEGARITGLEVSARRAMLEPSVDDAARERLAQMTAAGDPRLGLIDELVAAGDLVELNVAGGLNANFAFYAGLVDGGAFNRPITEQEMLGDVWDGESAVREETRAWLYSYLALAYQPLSDAELKEYIAITASPEGRAMNAALFVGFDKLFRQISRELGLEAAKYIGTDEL